jgi:N-formylglutamate deformylase
VNIQKTIILHIPHSSVIVTSSDGYMVERHELLNEINLLTDWFTDELFDLPYPKIISPCSRIFCDVERFADDSLEIMSKFGMGMCYTHYDNGILMREVTPKLREKIKLDYYDPHHRQLESLTSNILSSCGNAIIIDCHSYPDMPLIRDLNKEIPRPDFCIGSDDYHTPDNLMKVIKEYLNSKGYSVKINNPYAGTMIPLRYYQKEKEVKGIMIEVNRKLYTTSTNHEILKNAEFTTIKALINSMFNEITNLI